MPTHLEPADHLPLTALAFHILLALAGGAIHGYAIILDIERRSNGGMRVRSGTLYTAIQRLQDDGLLAECRERPPVDTDDKRRRYYEITPLGTEVAKLEASRMASMLDTAQSRIFAGGRP